MKLALLGFEFQAYRWHSINVIPHGSAYDVCDDKDHGKIIGRSYSATIFGVVTRVLVPSLQPREARKAWTSQNLGPCWSRRRRQWYFTDSYST
jgi:hypothetical protein